jgi:hypothetical protein
MAQRFAGKAGFDASPTVQPAAFRSAIDSLDIGDADVWQVLPVPGG